MGKTRREFTPEYKDEALKLVINTGRAIATVARELGINEASLGRWVISYKARNDTGETAVTESERAELLRLRPLGDRGGEAEHLGIGQADTVPGRRVTAQRDGVTKENGGPAQHMGDDRRAQIQPGPIEGSFIVDEQVDVFLKADDVGANYYRQSAL
jgi:transposase